MATTRTTSTLAGIAAAVALLGVAWPPRTTPPPTAQVQHESDEYEEDEYEEEGYAAAKARHQEPDAIEAAFPLQSYRPGAIAVLRIWTPTRAASVRVFHVGPEPQLTIGDKLMEGGAGERSTPIRRASRRPDDPDRGRQLAERRSTSRS